MRRHCNGTPAQVEAIRLPHDLKQEMLAALAWVKPQSWRAKRRETKTEFILTAIRQLLSKRSRGKKKVRRDPIIMSL
jgi:hypothetical protein